MTENRDLSKPLGTVYINKIQGVSENDTKAAQQTLEALKAIETELNQDPEDLVYDSLTKGVSRYKGEQLEKKGVLPSHIEDNLLEEQTLAQNAFISINYERLFEPRETISLVPQDKGLIQLPSRSSNKGVKALVIIKKDPKNLL